MRDKILKFDDLYIRPIMEMLMKFEDWLMS